ncbi:hypothetical protein [Neisseria chenwenguii]|uniref:Uncharacterized protein n=1 Tax=Neisseria chenwenguii TaxID=1853278 RepID=A0A220S179_9NEIS|nr:hypothetical protein [Neisseria chenwenguii]ASK26965.1 hypothetical protein BG910_03720 [Neisseria chenwenguii]ROV56133.1 hypothetical protein EGS38_06650 [Neisseria chenwenguii]
MLSQFLQDIWNILRLRYRAPEEYFYSLPVMAAVLLMLGLINAAAMEPLFGGGTAAVVFSVLLVTLKWLLLARAMRAVLRYYGAPPLPLWGFTLASEAANIPILAVLYIPQLAPVGLFWQVWAFWVQALGFMKMGNAAGWKVMLGYVVYFLATLFLGTVLLTLFMQAGWMDAETLRFRLESLMKAANG